MVDPAGFNAVGRSGVRTEAPRRATAQAGLASVVEPQTAPSVPMLVNMARELAEAGPPVDHARIAQIRQAIAQGRYAADPVAIAGAMLSFGKTSGA